MRGRTADGRVVELEQDCVCPQHEGPHWLYVERQRRALIRAEAAAIHEALDAGGVPPACRHRMEVRLMDLVEAERQLERMRCLAMSLAGIVAIIDEGA